MRSKRAGCGLPDTRHLSEVATALVCANAIVLTLRPFLTGTSAAQNGPVIQICSKCGALLLEETDTCSFCDGPLVAEDSVVPQPVAAGATHQETEPEPEWRREVSRRLEEYRVRRRRLRPDDPQSGLPFVREPEFEEEIPIPERPRPRANPRPRHTERMEIRIQPELDFSSSPDDRAHPQTALVPVAGLVERRLAGVLDAIFLVFAYAGFLGPFSLAWRRIDVSEGGRDCLRDDFLPVVRAIFLSVHYVCWGNAWDAAERHDDRSTRWNTSGNSATSVAELWVCAFGRDTDARFSMGALGRRSFHMAGSNFANVHYGCHACRKSGCV